MNSLLFLILIAYPLYRLVKITLGDLAHVIHQLETAGRVDWPITARILITCGIIGFLLTAIAYIILTYFLGIIKT